MSETFKVGKLTVHLEQDDQPESPREWDNFGKMYCCHSRYWLGDKHEMSPEALEEHITGTEVVACLRLWLYDHSGITMRCGVGNPSHERWDSSCVGYIFATEADVKREFGAVNAETIATAMRCLAQEVEVYDQYLTGDVWVYDIKDEEDNVLDSCGGLYESDYAEKKAKEAAECLWKKIQAREQVLAYRED